MRTDGLLFDSRGLYRRFYVDQIGAKVYAPGRRDACLRLEFFSLTGIAAPGPTGVHEHDTARCRV